VLILLHLKKVFIIYLRSYLQVKFKHQDPFIMIHSIKIILSVFLCFLVFFALSCDESDPVSTKTPLQKAIDAALNCDNVNEELGLTMQEYIDTVEDYCSDACISCVNAQNGDCDAMEDNCDECYMGDCVLLDW